MPSRRHEVQSAGIAEGAADVGVQAERTALAWRRTSLALLVVSTLLLRWIGLHGYRVLMPAAFALLLSVICATRLGKRYVRKQQGVAGEHYEPEIALILLLTIGVLVLGSAVACIVMTAP